MNNNTLEFCCTRNYTELKLKANHNIVGSMLRIEVVVLEITQN